MVGERARLSLRSARLSQANCRSERSRDNPSTMISTIRFSFFSTRRRARRVYAELRRAVPVWSVCARVVLTGASWFALLLTVPWLANAQTAPDTGWPTYGNDPGGTRYSPAKQIDLSNVAQLKVAWTYRTGALPYDADLDKKAAFETTPILIEGKLFVS